MTEVNVSNALSSEEPLFRAAKRRKFYRKHNANDDENGVAARISSEHSIAVPRTEGTHTDPDDNQTARDGETETHHTMAEVLRRRQAARNRRGGIEFTNSTSTTKSDFAPPQPSGPLVEKGEPPKDLHPVADRFAPQTGQVADVDKHM